MGRFPRYFKRGRASRSHSPVRSVSAHGERQTAVGRGLYPDGTVNSFVLRYLRERVLKLLDAKPRKPAKGT